MALQKAAKVEVVLDLDRAKAQIEGLKAKEADLDAIAKKAEDIHKRRLEERTRNAQTMREHIRQIPGSIVRGGIGAVQNAARLARFGQPEEIIALGEELAASAIATGIRLAAPGVDPKTGVSMLSAAETIETTGQRAGAAIRFVSPYIEEFGPAGIAVAKKIAGDNPMLQEAIDKAIKPIIDTMSDQLTRMRAELNGFRASFQRTSTMVATQFLLGGSPSVKMTEQMFFDLQAVERTKSQVELTQRKVQKQIIAGKGAETILSLLPQLLAGQGLGR